MARTTMDRVLRAELASDLDLTCPIVLVVGGKVGDGDELACVASIDDTGGHQGQGHYDVPEEVVMCGLPSILRYLADEADKRPEPPPHQSTPETKAFVQRIAALRPGDDVAVFSWLDTETGGDAWRWRGTLVRREGSRAWVSDSTSAVYEYPSGDVIPLGDDAYGEALPTVASRSDQFYHG